VNFPDSLAEQSFSAFLYVYHSSTGATRRHPKSDAAKIGIIFEITKKKRKKFWNVSPVMWGVMRCGTSMQIQLNWSANSVNLVSKFTEFAVPVCIFCFVVDIVLSYK
jgi:hypothetical protein